MQSSEFETEKEAVQDCCSILQKTAHQVLLLLFFFFFFDFASFPTRTLGIIGIVSELYSGLTSKISSPIPIKIDETRVLNPPSSKPSPLLEFQATKSSKERSPKVTDCRSRRSPVVEALDSEGGSGDLLGCC